MSKINFIIHCDVMHISKSFYNGNEIEEPAVLMYELYDCIEQGYK